jgi:hypothetical protein
MRWWLATKLANWAHTLVRPESGDAWLEEFVATYVRAHQPPVLSRLSHDEQRVASPPQQSRRLAERPGNAQ